MSVVDPLLAVAVGSYLVSVLVIHPQAPVLSFHNLMALLIEPADLIPRSQHDSVPVFVVAVDVAPFVFLNTIAQFVILDDLSVLTLYCLEPVIRIIRLGLAFVVLPDVVTLFVLVGDFA